MIELEKIREYIKKNPKESDKRIGKRFNLKKGEVRELRLYFENENFSSRNKSIPRFVKKIKFKNLLGEKGSEIIKFLEKISNLNFLMFFLFLLGILIRFLYLFYFKKYDFLNFPILDSQYYLEWAQAIAKEGIVGQKIFFTEPFYAYFLAFLRKISDSNFLAIGIQMILGSFLPIIIFKIGEKTVNRVVGLLAGVTAALYGPFIFYEGLILKTTLEIFFLTIFFLVLLKIFSSKNKIGFLAAGLLLGFTATIKGNVLIIFPIVIFFLFHFFPKERKSNLLLSIYFTAGLLLAISPITLRNYLVGKDFVPINYSVGIVIYQGNWWNGDGSTAMAPSFFRPHPKFEEADSYKMAEAYQEKELKPSEVSRFWLKKAISESFQDPGHWLSSTGKKFVLLANHNELSDNYSYDFYKKFIPFLKFLPGYWLIFSLGLTGIIFIIFSKDLKSLIDPDRKKIKLLLGIIGAYVLLLVIANINSRYRMPIVPFLIIPGAILIWYALIKFKEEEYRKLIFILFIFSCSLGFSTLKLKLNELVNDSNAYFQVGYYYLDQGNYLKAKEYFEKTIEIDDKYAWAYSNLFLIHLQNGELDDAKKYLQKLIVIRPDDLSHYEKVALIKKVEGKSIDLEIAKAEAKKMLADEKTINEYDPYAYEAMKYLKAKNYSKAEELFKISAEKFDNPANTLINLSSIERNNNKNVEEAKKYLELAIKKNPYLFPAKYNLANIYIEEKNFMQVAFLLRDIYDFSPELGETWYNLAVAYINLKNNAANQVIASYVERYQNDPVKKEKVEKFKSFLLQNKTGKK